MSRQCLFLLVLALSSCAHPAAVEVVETANPGAPGVITLPEVEPTTAVPSRQTMAQVRAARLARRREDEVRWSQATDNGRLLTLDKASDLLPHMTRPWIVGDLLATAHAGDDVYRLAAIMCVVAEVGDIRALALLYDVWQDESRHEGIREYARDLLAGRVGSSPKPKFGDAGKLTDESVREIAEWWNTYPGVLGAQPRPKDQQDAAGALSRARTLHEMGQTVLAIHVLYYYRNVPFGSPRERLEFGDAMVGLIEQLPPGTELELLRRTVARTCVAKAMRMHPGQYSQATPMPQVFGSLMAEDDV